ncbi:MAG TPA: hypothetical protein VF017_18695 [Thermoanaerobaculia bacterium]|nr:hypothetical protein [Thermoanaerobaculia bacterium]
MARMSITEILERLSLDISSLMREATAIREQLARTAQPKYYMSLYAMLMAVFSQVDLLGCLFAGSVKTKGQTKRMIKFLARYTKRKPEAIMLAVQLYRHTLMHTGRPRELLDETTGQRHYFLLHWGREHADEAAHFTVTVDGTLTLNLECLLEDLHSAFDGFRAEATSDAMLGERIEATWPHIALQRFRPAV